ncbi:MAG: hypothetical protein M0018_09955 [Nitrospiraceae bacterium]|nr:hypothetical protein [Nitrospiraceae bacterium]
MRIKRPVRAIVFCAALCLLCSCGSIGTIKGMTGSQAFQAQNLPVRNLRVAVFTDGSKPDKEIKRTIALASDSLRKQVGIALVPVSWQKIQFKSSGRAAMINQLYRRTLKTLPGNSFDIAVAFTSYNAMDDLKFVFSMLVMPVPVWAGVIDDTYRRYIVMKSTDKDNLIHEVCHGFLFEYVHSSRGVMQGTKLVLLPFTPPINETQYLTAQDRNNILKHKFRDFSMRPRLNLPEGDLLNTGQSAASSVQ